MKRSLNPELVKYPRPQDGLPGEHYVFLRDPIVHGEIRDVGIGDLGVIDIEEDEEKAVGMRKDKHAMEELMNEQHEAIPLRVFETHGGFGFPSNERIFLVIESRSSIFVGEGKKQ